MLRIGIILFGIGLFMLSPIDEIFILLPASAVLGVWVFPVAIFIAFACLIIGAMLIGKHLGPLMHNPIVIIMILFAIVIMVYLAISNGWFEF